MASTTLTQYRLRVSAIIGLTGTAAGDEQTLIDGWVNEAQEQVLLKTHCKVGTATMALTSGTDDYTLDSAILSILDLYNTVSTTDYPLIRLTTQDLLTYRMNQPSSPTTAQWYCQQANTLMLYPTPGSGETLTIFYVPRPTAMTTGANTPDSVPAEWHVALEYYAFARAAEYNEQGPSQFGSYWRALFERTCQEMKTAERRLGGTRPAAMKLGRYPRPVYSDPSRIAR